MGLRSLATAAAKAAECDSNDEEIDALRDALDDALSTLGLPCLSELAEDEEGPTDKRVFVVTVRVGDDVGVDVAMEKAMLVMSDRIWADCNTQQPWSIEVAEGDQERSDMSYSFTPESEED